MNRLSVISTIALDHARLFCQSDENTVDCCSYSSGDVCFLSAVVDTQDH